MGLCALTLWRKGLVPSQSQGYSPAETVVSYFWVGVCDV